MGICILITLVSSMLFQHGDALCTYPSDLRGTWQDSAYGPVDFSNSAMYMQTKGFLSGTSSTNFTCEMSSGNLYVSKSVGTVTINIAGGITVNVYICVELMSLTTSVSYYYNLRSSDTANLNFGDVVPIAVTQTTAISDICNTVAVGRQFHMLVNSATAATGLQECPLPLLGDFTYKVNFGDATTQCGDSAYWNGCTNTSVISLNNTQCTTQFVGYSSTGYLGCVHSLQDTTTTSIYYVGVYNFDSSVNGQSTRRFTCFAVEQFNSSATNVSQSPDRCTADQTPSSLPTNGALLQLSTVKSCAPVAALSELLSIVEILAIVFSVMLVIFLILVIGICIYRWRIRKRQVKIVIIPKQLPRGAHTVLTMSDTSTVVNKEIITEPKLVVKPIRNGQPQSMELQEWKNNSEFTEPAGQLTIVRKPQPIVEKIDPMKSRVATQMREESDRKRNMASVIDRVKTNLAREIRVISILKAKEFASRDELTREGTMSKFSHNTTLAPPKSRMSQYIHDPSSKSRSMSMRKNKVTNGTAPHLGPADHSFNSSINPRTSTPVSVRPSSIDMVMSEANLSIFSADMKPLASRTPKPQPDITVTRKIKNTKKFPAIRELSNMPGDFQNFER